MEDTRYVYGINCSWHDSIHKAATRHESGLPCCPICAGMLMECETEEKFFKGAEEMNFTTPNYLTFINWNRGKCHKTIRIAADKFTLITGLHVDI